MDQRLGNSSHLIASEESGRAVVTYPERDVDRYVRFAQGLGLTLTYALETHLHADFVSGLRGLAEQSKVMIGASAELQRAFEHLPLREGDTISLRDLTLGVLDRKTRTIKHEAERLNSPPF